MDTVLIYARVSTEDQLEKYGLSSQLRACREFAAARGWQILEEITDDGISGVILDRPGLDRVRRLVREGAATFVLMFDADRLSRELAHLLILKPEIEKHARLEFVAAKFEDSPSGRMFFGMRGVIAQYEREVIRERTMRGKKERARAGLISGGRIAYGYCYKEGKLLPDVERAPIVQRIFTAYDSGLSLRAVVQELRAAGLPTWGGKPWERSSVRRILANETYAGVAYYGTLRREGKSVRVRTSGERIPLSVPPLVDRAIWERVGARLAANPLVGRPSSAYLLRGLLFCAQCGRRMCGERGRSNAYRCVGRDPLRAPSGVLCKHSISVARLDAVVWRKLVEVCTNGEALRAILGRREEELKTSSGEVERLRSRLAKAKGREEAALSALLDPDLASTRGSIKEKYRAATEERRRVELELSGLEASLPPAIEGDWIEHTVDLLRGYLANLDDAAERQQVARRLLNRVEWDGIEARMSFSIGPELATSSTRSARFSRLQFVVTARLAA